MFYRFDELLPDALQADRYERATAIAAGLPEAEIRSIERRQVELYLPNMDEVVQGDVSRNGFTVYLGGFDWVTFVAPPHVISRFPDLLPLPQQASSMDEAAESGEVPDLSEIPGLGDMPDLSELSGVADDADAADEEEL